MKCYRPFLSSSLAALVWLALAPGAWSQTALETSFEAGEGYSIGSVSSRPGWSVRDGAAAVTADAAYVEEGTQGLRVSTSGRLRVDHTAFSGSEDGIGGIVYADFWINVVSLPDRSFTINGYDLYGGSRKRAFVIDLTPSREVRIYDGFTATPIGSYTVGEWTRITARIDYDAATYQVSLNAAEPVGVAFRETYTPGASGTRTAGERQYHALTFNLGSDDIAGTADVGLDRLYVGTTAPAGVTFPTITPQFSVSLIQPSAGTLALAPAGPTFDEGTEVTATVTPDDGFVFCGWTGDVDGPGASVTFTVDRDLAIRPFVCADPDNPPTTRTVSVSSASALREAIEEARPGETIELADGTYDIGGLSVRKGGVEGYPVTIRAKTIGGVTLTGGSSFSLKKVAYVTIEGFVFESTDVTAVKTESASHARITRNVFRLNETGSLKWVVIGGSFDLTEPFSDHNRIDHNRFEDKAELGNFVTIDGSAPPNALASQHDRIDHNHFLRTGPRATNEKEAVRVGWSAMSLSSGFTVVEHNLFEECDGDPEVISVKVSDATVRYNTFRRSQGTLSIRHGDRTRVEGNVFLGEGRAGTGGIRFYGDDHTIINNVMTGLMGTRFDAPIAVTNGDADYSATTTDLTKHFRPQRATIAHNTLVGNAHGIEIGYTGSGYNRPPRDLTFEGNIVEGDQNSLVHVYTPPENATWAGNLMWPTGAATLGVTATEAEIRVADPLLASGAEPWLLTASSPAIDAASGAAAPALDVQGQTRAGADIGADEYAPDQPIHFAPLTAADVGPAAATATLSEQTGSVRVAMTLELAGPNPIRARTAFSLAIAAPSPVEVALFDALGRRVALLHDGFLGAGVHPLTVDTRGLASGIYFLQASATSGSVTRTVTVVR